MTPEKPREGLFAFPGGSLKQTQSTTLRPSSFTSPHNKPPHPPHRSLPGVSVDQRLALTLLLGGCTEPQEPGACRGAPCERGGAARRAGGTQGGKGSHIRCVLPPPQSSGALRSDRPGEESSREGE